MSHLAVLCKCFCDFLGCRESLSLALFLPPSEGQRKRTYTYNRTPAKNEKLMVVAEQAAPKTIAQYRARFKARCPKPTPGKLRIFTLSRAHHSLTQSTKTRQGGAQFAIKTCCGWVRGYDDGGEDDHRGMDHDGGKDDDKGSKDNGNEDEEGSSNVARGSNDVLWGKGQDTGMMIWQ